MPNPIIATLITSLYGEIVGIYPGSLAVPEVEDCPTIEQVEVQLTDQDLYNLILAGREFYQRQLVEGIKAGLICNSSPPDSKL